MNFEFAISILEVAGNRMTGDAEPAGNRAVGAAEGQQAQHVYFACSEIAALHMVEAHLRSCGSPVASNGTNVTSATPIASTATAGSAARHTSGSGLPKR